MTIDVALAIPVRAGRVLVARRAAGAHLGGVWEFPGGKIENGEEPAAAASRELHEETGLAGGSLEPLLVHVYDYPDRSVRLHVYLVREPEGEVATDADRACAWIGPDELAALAMPAANAPILRALRWRLDG